MTSTAELKARLAAAHAALERAKRTGEEGGVAPEARESVRGHYEDRIRRYAAGLAAGGTTEEYREGSEAWRSWRRGLIAAEREEIVALRDRGEVSAEAMRRVERDLDLEESRLGGVALIPGLSGQKFGARVNIHPSRVVSGYERK